MSRIFIECGTALRSPYNTGIQRVVRSIVRELKQIEDMTSNRFIFIEFRGGKAFEMSQVDDWRKKNNVGIIPKVLTAARSIDRLLHKIINRKFYSFIRSRILPVIREKYYQITSRSIGVSVLFSDIEDDNEHGKIANSDTLILLDSSWNNDIWEEVDEFRARGGWACAVLYDLIPFTHPDTVEEHTRQLHTSWWSKAPEHLDSVICISKTVKNEFIDWQKQANIKKIIPDNMVKYFYLGAEMNQGKEEQILLNILQNKDPVFLVVGSIEPRKNHGVILDAFDRIWSEGAKTNLVIVGGNGWKCEAVIERIKEHTQFNTRLYMLRKVSDLELDLLYSKATALIIASSAEGFGLPIVEALLRGTKVICSDIPVFREVAAENSAYFNLNDSQALAEILTTFEVREGEKLLKKGDISEWITWRESAIQLIEQAETKYLVSKQEDILEYKKSKLM